MEEMTAVVGFVLFAMFLFWMFSMHLGFHATAVFIVCMAGMVTSAYLPFSPGVILTALVCYIPGHFLYAVKFPGEYNGW